MTQYKGMIFVSVFLDSMLFVIIITSRPFSASKIQPTRCHVARNIQPTRLHPFSAMFKRYQCWLGVLAMTYQASFQGKHSDKLPITYKAEGDGFQCDALCESGFTWTFYFHNQPAPKKYLQQGYAPLHSCILGMFDQLDEKHHNCWFDNLYLSAKFCRAAFTHPNVVCIAGPTRKSGRGLPQCVLQEEVQGTAEIRHVRGTVKAAALEGDEM